MKRALVIRVGFSGMSAAVELSRRGFSVTVLDAHIYPGVVLGRTALHQCELREA